MTLKQASIERDSTDSTTFTEIKGLSLTYSTRSDKAVEIVAFMDVYSENKGFVCFDLAIDGERMGDTNLGIHTVHPMGATIEQTGFMFIPARIMKGKHTYSVYWKVSDGEGVVSNAKLAVQKSNSMGRGKKSRFDYS